MALPNYKRHEFLSELTCNEGAKLGRIKAVLFERLSHVLYPAGSYAREKSKDLSSPPFSESKKELSLIFWLWHPFVNFNPVATETELKDTLESNPLLQHVKTSF